MGGKIRYPGPHLEYNTHPNLHEETQNQLLALANDADNPLMFITAVFPERWGLTQGATLSHETRQLTHYGGTKSIICLRIDLLERAIYANYSESKSNWLHHIFSLAVCIGHELAHALCSVHHFPLENYEMEAVFPRHVLPELGWSFEHFVLGYIVTALGADSTMHHGSIATKLLSGSSRGKMEVLISPEALRGMQFGSKKTHQTHSYPISCKYMNDLFSEQWWVSMMPSFSRHSCKIPVDENLKRVIMHTHTKIEEDDYGWDGESMVSPVPNTLISNIDVDSELSDEG
ncbi:MAG: hypothetical protein M1814_000034 [Vezdaea aestivalis]|nr:MAG: hypothetical protein M1814_000034 [Vezdaea aestivalis]